MQYDTPKEEIIAMHCDIVKERFALASKESVVCNFPLLDNSITRHSEHMEYNAAALSTDTIR